MQNELETDVGRETGGSLSNRPHDGIEANQPESLDQIRSTCLQV